MRKHVQKIRASDDISILISNIDIRTREIEYYAMNHNVIVIPKKTVPIEFMNDTVIFEGIEINKQYLIQLLMERDHTLLEIDKMFNLSEVG